MSTPDPQDSTSPLYTIVDTNPLSSAPNTLDTSPSYFTERQFTPESITSALPVVVTKTSHGLQNGQAIRATKFISLPLASATGFEQINNLLFYAEQCTDDTFLLYSVDGLPVNGTSFTTFVSGGQFTVISSQLCVNPSTFPV